MLLIFNPTAVEPPAADVTWRVSRSCLEGETRNRPDSAMRAALKCCELHSHDHIQHSSSLLA